MDRDSQRHFYWLDALRFVAAFMVLFGHSRNDFFLMWNDLPSEQQTLLASLFYLLGRLAHESVLVFFVLSGFLVGGKGLERIIEGSFDTKEYLVARFSRIYPPLFTAIVFYYITCAVIPSQDWNWITAFGNMLNLQGILSKCLVSPFWSLAYEWWFYMVVALLGLSLSKGKASVKLLGFVGFCLVIGIFTLGNMKMHYLIVWLIGAVAYLVRPTSPNKCMLFVALLGIITGVAMLQMSSGSNSIHFTLKIANRPFLEIYMALMISLLIQQLVLNEPKPGVSKAIEMCLGKMSKFSYTLYLSHRIVLLWIFYFICEKSGGQMTCSSFALYMCIIMVCLLSCWCLYLVSEKHTLAIRNKIKVLISHI